MPLHRRSCSRPEHIVAIRDPAPPHGVATPLLQLLPRRCASSAWLQRNPVNAQQLGRLLLSAWQEVILQRRHCRTKDWPYSQAAKVVRMFFFCFFDCLILQDDVMWEFWGACVARKEARFEVLEMNADALRLSR